MEIAEQDDNSSVIVLADGMGSGVKASIMSTLSSRIISTMICRLLFEEATYINFYVGKAVNPAHQNPDLPTNFFIKMNIVKQLSEALQKMGKQVRTSYF